MAQFLCRYGVLERAHCRMGSSRTVAENAMNYDGMVYWPMDLRTETLARNCTTGYIFGVSRKLRIHEDL